MDAAVFAQVKSRKPDDCAIVALSMLLRVGYESVVSAFGNRLLTQPDMIYAAYCQGISLVTFEREYYVGGEKRETPDFEKEILKIPGLCIRTNPGGNMHVAYYNGHTIWDKDPISEIDIWYPMVHLAKSGRFEKP